MTVTEFSNEFDIAYNSIATNDAPNIDLYEKSVYLTKAQLELIKNYFNPGGNKYKVGFEGSSKRRADLNELIRHYNATNQTTKTKGLSVCSQFFTIPFDTFIIINESAKVESEDKCVDGKYINVVPKTYDEYNIQKDNPFRKPNKDIIWRMDYSNLEGNKTVELIPFTPVVEYRMRYIKYPTPIILTNLEESFPGEGLTIDGIITKQTSLLNESIHREILDRAVQLALRDYKPQHLASNVQLDLRNE